MYKKTRKAIALVLVGTMLLAALALTGCAKTEDSKGSKEDSKTSSKTSSKEKGDDVLKVAMVCSGPVNDGSWNMDGYNGLKAVEEKLGAEIAYSEMVPIDELPTVLRSYGREKFDIIFAHSVEYDEQMKRIAPEFPDAQFVTIGGNTTGDNLYAAQFQYWELSYFLGMAGALMSESNQISIITAMDTPTHQVELKAYTEGAQYANADCKVKAAYTGDWVDMAKSKEATLAQIADGSDVLLANVSSAAAAILGTCQEKGVKGLGWGVDMSTFAEDTVITSGLFAMTDLYVGVTEQVLEGTEERELQLSMRDGFMSLCEMPDWVSPDVQKTVDKRMAEYMDGAFEIEGMK